MALENASNPKAAFFTQAAGALFRSSWSRSWRSVGIGRPSTYASIISTIRIGIRILRTTFTFLCRERWAISFTEGSVAFRNLILELQALPATMGGVPGTQWPMGGVNSWKQVLRPLRIISLN